MITHRQPTRRGPRFLDNRHRISAAVIVIIAMSAGLAGCGPSKLLPPPPNLPTEVEGRQLWNTPSAVIYARDKSVAGEAESLVRSLNAELESYCDRKLGRGLIIVVDTDDPQGLITTMEEAERLSPKPEKKKDDKAPATQPSDGEDDGKLALEELGITEEFMCRMISVPLDAVALDRIGLTAECRVGLEWFICYPSQRQTKHCFRKITDAALDKEGGIAAKIMVAPWMPLILGEAAKKLEQGTQLLIVGLWSRLQGDWSAHRRHEVVEAIAERIGFNDEIKLPDPASQPATVDDPSAEVDPPEEADPAAPK